MPIFFFDNSMFFFNLTIFFHKDIKALQRSYIARFFELFLGILVGENWTKIHPYNPFGNI